MDPLGTAAQAGGTVCWKGQEQGCQYQGTAIRLFYKLALIKRGGRAARSHAVWLCTPALLRGQAPSPGSKACCSSAIQWNPQCQAGVKGLHPGGVACSWLWDLLILLCSLARDVMQGTRPSTSRLHVYRLSRPPSRLKMSPGSYSPQSSCCTHHPWREVLGSPRPDSHPQSRHGQPPPALSTLLCAYTFQVVQPDADEALSNAYGRTQTSNFFW